MERRTFLQTTLAATACATAAGSSEGADGRRAEFYELRTYTLKKSKLPMLDDYLKQAFIPALKRLKFGPVGVFVEQAEDDNLRLFVLIIHPTAESCLTLNARLAGDMEHQRAGQNYLAATAADPVYTRIESSVLVALDGMPQLIPVDADKPRVLQLRTYESHNERASKKKIEMFNQGEIAIFRRVGLTPMFFAETIVGSAMPNLTYLLVFPDEQARTEAWNTFRSDPEWLKLKSIPEYADREIVSKITNRVLTPAAYSEL
jgi:hypothetical protein